MPDAALDDERRERPARIGVWLSAAAAVLALLLPWSAGDGYTRDAFGRSGWAAAFALGTVAGTVTLLGAYRAQPRPRLLTALQGWAISGAVFSAVAALGVAASKNQHNTVGADDGRWAGPGTLIVALAAMAASTHFVARGPSADAGARLRGMAPPPTARLLAAALGALGLAIAVAGLFGPWERLHSVALEPLTGDASAVWTGPELAATLALRWVLAAAAIAAALSFTLRWTRDVALPLVLIAAGAAIMALSLPQALTSELRGVNATLGPGAGAWICAAGGLLAALGGVLALVSARTWRRRMPLAATAAALLAGGVLVATPDPHAAADDPAHAIKVFGDGTGSSRLGVRAVEADVRYTQLDQATSFDLSRADAVATGTGTFFLTTTTYRDDFEATLISQVVHGRALPVTLLTGGEDVTMLAVVGHRAVVQARSDRAGSVQSVDLREPSSSVQSYGRSPGPHWPASPQVLLTSIVSPGDSTARPGYLAAERFRVEMAPDGGALVRADGQPSDQQRNYRVSASTVRSGAVWHLAPAPAADLAGRGGVQYSLADAAVTAIAPDGGRKRVLGGVSDTRCTASRDPLSTSLEERFLPHGPPGATVDRGGNLWLVLGRPSARTSVFEVYVLTTDGVLRRLGGRLGSNARAVQAMPDGSLFIRQVRRLGSSFVGGSTYRIDDAQAAARAAPALGPVARDCVSDNRVQVRTLARPVRHLVLTPEPVDGNGTFPAAHAVLDARGTRIYSLSGGEDSVRLVSQPLGGKGLTVYRAAKTQIDEVVADGRGGAWWVQRPADGRTQSASIGHLDASGTARIVRRGVAPTSAGKEFRRVDIEADTGDGSVWLRWAEDVAWSRVTLDGRLTRLGYPGAAPVVSGGRGYVSTERGVRIDTVRSNGQGAPVLGGGRPRLALPSAIAAHTSRADTVTYGELSVSPAGQLLLHQGDYLARLGPRGPIELLSGVADGLPYRGRYSSAFIETVIGSTLVIYDGARNVYTVDVS